MSIDLSDLAVSLIRLDLMFRIAQETEKVDASGIDGVYEGDREIGS